ncbi:uncharacterized protein B0H64DRAFT_390065 [Chaetomium fimeti]|uniref:RING-type domain-containing protein n=1 Tax=Chaetomium fimeti TaxID=1854472 RepID=A0AAE0LT03_9PEZI|nr:hypothetical protein B0H64DRAFT_390065 [Chaetomium fimeti]
MFRGPSRNEISITQTFDAIRVVDNYRNSLDCGGTLGVKLMRTTRIPDDGKTYHLPQDFGPFPLLSTEDFKDTLPPRMKDKGGVFIPMLLREALFLSMLLPSDGPFRSLWPDSTPADEPANESFAMRVYAGRLNVVSAADPVGSHLNPKEPEQDYIVVPKQSRLDGFTSVSGHTMRQFNAVSLGSNYSAESQVSGDEVGGLQLQFAPRFKRNVEFQELLGGAPLDITATPRELGPRVNGLLLMEPNLDPVFSPPVWNAHNLRPPAFDGWGFREGGYKASNSEFLWPPPFRRDASKVGGAPSSQRKGDTEKSTNTAPPMFATGGFPTDALGVPYQEGRPHARQPTPEKAKVGHLEPARPSTVSDLFAAAGVSFGTPLFLKPVRPITVDFDVKVKIPPTKPSYAVGGWANVPIAMKVAVTTSVFEDALSFHDRVMAAVKHHFRGVVDEEYHNLNFGCFDLMGESEIREVYGESFPTYMAIHRLSISKARCVEMKIEELVSYSEPRYRTDQPEFELSLAPGAIVEQRVYKDRTPRLWNWDTTAVVNVQILNAVAFKSATGLSPPIPAISFDEYTRAGLPLLSFYDTDDSEPLRRLTEPSNPIRSIGDIDRHHDLAVGVRMKPGHRPVICAICEHRLCNAVLVPCHHIFCSWCIRFSMTEDEGVTCGFCRKPAPTVNVYAAATDIDKGPAPSETRSQEGATPVQKLLGLFDRDSGQDWPTRPMREWRGNPDLGNLIPIVPPSALMIAQIFREWEMGLRSEAKVQDLAMELFTGLKMEERGSEDPLKAFVTLAASMERDWGEWGFLVQGEPRKKRFGRGG